MFQPKGQPMFQPPRLLMLDLCSGLGGASASMVDRGWNVIRIDIERRFCPDVVADVRDLVLRGIKPDLIWASPPCTEYSRFGMPCWFDVSSLPDPDPSIWDGCLRIIKELEPRWWVLENVKGAVIFRGKPRQRFGPYCLWGWFPPLSFRLKPTEGGKTKRVRKPEERAMIPYSLSSALADAIERSITYV